MIFFVIVDEHAEAAAAGPPGGGVAFLLVQLGFQAGRQFGEWLAPTSAWSSGRPGAPTGLAASEGRSQQAIAALLGINATQMVFLVDELERLGLVAAQGAILPTGDLDALYLTGRAGDAGAGLRAVTAEHEASITAGLTARSASSC